MLDKNEMRENLQQMKDCSSIMIETILSLAKYNRTMFEGYIEQGFSEEQALELVKVHGLSLQQK